MFKVGAGAGVGLVCAAAVVLLYAGETQAQGKPKPKLKQWGDEQIHCVKDFAWQLTPPSFTPPNGKTIVVDKKKRKSVEVPMEIAREAVETGRVSAYAQSCGLLEDQVSNQRTFMKRAEVGNKWTEQQMLYLRTIHLATVMLLTGQLTAQDLDTGQKLKRDESIPLCGGVTLKLPSPEKRAVPCSDKQKQQAKALVQAYVDADPAPVQKKKR
jgi:hypothetical protein